MKPRRPPVLRRDGDGPKSGDPTAPRPGASGVQVVTGSGFPDLPPVLGRGRISAAGEPVGGARRAVSPRGPSRGRPVQLFPPGPGFPPARTPDLLQEGLG